MTVHRYKHFPLDVVGWDGFLYPMSINILDFQPITGKVHQPPTTHTTFAGNDFVVCSFVPRMVDYHPEAVPCPYGHSSVDMDEIMYYVDGNFSSRKGIAVESINLHPQRPPPRYTLMARVREEFFPLPNRIPLETHFPDKIPSS